MHAHAQVAPIPADIADRRCEITGPVDRKMVINALNSGASVYMADFEDSNTPTWCAPELAINVTQRVADHNTPKCGALVGWLGVVGSPLVCIYGLHKSRPGNFLHARAVVVHLWVPAFRVGHLLSLTWSRAPFYGFPVCVRHAAAPASAL